MILQNQKKEAKQAVFTLSSCDTFERCVLCGTLTDIPLSMNIDLRYGYVEGAGQLCRKCYHELFGDRGRK